VFKRIDSMVQYSMVCITLFQRLEAEWAGVVEKKRFFIKHISIVQCLCYANGNWQRWACGPLRKTDPTLSSLLNSKQEEVQVESGRETDGRYSLEPMSMRMSDDDQQNSVKVQ